MACEKRSPKLTSEYKKEYQDYLAAYKTYLKSADKKKNDRIIDKLTQELPDELGAYLDKMSAKTTITQDGYTKETIGKTVEDDICKVFKNILKSEPGVDVVVQESKNAFPDLIISTAKNKYTIGIDIKVTENMTMGEGCGASANDLGTIASWMDEKFWKLQELYVLMVEYKQNKDTQKYVFDRFYFVPFVHVFGLSSSKEANEPHLRYRLKDGNLRPRCFKDIPEVMIKEGKKWKRKVQKIDSSYKTLFPNGHPDAYPWLVQTRDVWVVERVFNLFKELTVQNKRRLCNMLKCATA